MNAFLRFTALALALAPAAAFVPHPHARMPIRALRSEPVEAETAEAETAEAPPAPVAAGLGTERLDELTLAAQSTAMDNIAKEWRRKRANREYEDSKLLGFTAQAEIVNGRSAMFFIVVGLLTESFSGESIPQVSVFVWRRICGSRACQMYFCPNPTRVCALLTRPPRTMFL